MRVSATPACRPIQQAQGLRTAPEIGSVAVKSLLCSESHTSLRVLFTSGENGRPR